MPEKPPAFPLFVRDWLTETVHLSLQEQGALMRLLCFQWLKGPFQDDPVSVGRILGSPRQRALALWRALGGFFSPIDGSPGLVANARLERERQRQGERRQALSDAGQRGAGKRWGSQEAPPDDPAKGHANGQATDGRKAGHKPGHKGGDKLAVAFAVASADDDVRTSSRTSYTRPAARTERIMAAVRRHLYLPDGIPGQNSTEDRDRDILDKQLAEIQEGEILEAIEGLALLREAAELGTLAAPGGKLSLRPLVNDGELWQRCLTAARRNNTQRRGASSGRLEHISQVLPQAAGAPAARAVAS